MIEASGMLGWLSAALLFAAVAAWCKVWHGPVPQRLNGSRRSTNGDVENASRLLAIAAAASAVAAIVAILGLMLE